MPDYYIKVSGASTALGHVAGDAVTNPLTSQEGDKIWYRAATLSGQIDAYHGGPSYDVANGTITHPYRSLADCKAARQSAIDAQRDTLLAAGKTILTHTMDGRFTTVGAVVAKRDRLDRKGGSAVKNVNGVNTGTGVITVTGGAPNDGLEVQFASIGGTTELNGNVYFVANSSGNTFTLQDRLGADVDMSGFTTYTSGGTATVVATTIDVDNNLVALSYADFTTLADTLSLWFNAMFEQGRDHKNAVDALSTAAEVESYDSSDWPA